MRKAADLADGRMDAIRNVEQEMSNLAAAGMQKPPQWDTMAYNDKVAHLDAMQKALGNVGDVSNKMQDMVGKEKDTLKELDNMGVGDAQPAMVARARFNLRRFAQDMGQPAPQAAPQTLPEPPASDIPTDGNNDGQTSVSEVRGLLDGFVSDAINGGSDPKKAVAMAVDKAFSYITDNFTNPNDSTTDPQSGAHGNSEQLVRNAVTTYYSTMDESEKDQAASILARTVFPQGQDEGSSVPATQKSVKVDFAKVVNETNKLIKAMAERDSKTAATKKAKTVFNLTKQIGRAHV